MSKCETGLKDMLAAVEEYCEGFEAEVGVPAGEDYYLGTEGVLEILRGLRVLLNGPTGKIDCGSMDGRILEIAALHGFEQLK